MAGDTAHEERIVKDVALDPLTPRAVAREFHELVQRVPLVASGDAAERPDVLLERGYIARQRLRVFDLLIYLTARRFDDQIGFFIAYVGPLSSRASRESGVPRRLHPRIFYKDSSLVWRVATHLVEAENEIWIGKGDVKPVVEHGEKLWATAEETTNLPYEIQAALDTASREGPKPRRDGLAVPLILRHGPPGQVRPFADFAGPRRRARERGRIYGGRRVARFTKRGDPKSLVFAPGYEPDLRRGVLERAESASNIYGGKIEKIRIVSKNRRIQYQFVVGPHHVWINPPQALTTELSTFAVRTVDVAADDELFLPGYEYHYLDETEDPPVLHSQIPEGFAGEPSAVDPARADASAWIERMPVVREFRRVVLGRVEPR